MEIKKNIQEYYAPTGTGKSFHIIPMQMHINAKLGCQNYLIICRRDQHYINSFKRIRRQLEGLKYYFKKQLYNVSVFEFQEDIHNDANYTFVTKLSKWLKDKSTNQTNIIIDEVDFLQDRYETILEDVNKFPYKILTLVGIEEISASNLKVMEEW